MRIMTNYCITVCMCFSARGLSIRVCDYTVIYVYYTVIPNQPSPLCPNDVCLGLAYEKTSLKHSGLRTGFSFLLARSGIGFSQR